MQQATNDMDAGKAEQDDPITSAEEYGSRHQYCGPKPRQLYADQADDEDGSKYIQKRQYNAAA